MAFGVRAAAEEDSRRWDPIDADRVHDPASPAAALLQPPGEALRELPMDSAGNYVRWVEALREGLIQPRTNVLETTEVRTLDLDICLPRTGEMHPVKFPHLPHTEWLDCKNCHDHLFAQEAGATPINMFEVLQGEYCGRCHGAVAFPLTECGRCHSVPREDLDATDCIKPRKKGG